MIDVEIGARLSNSAYERRWTCPACYYDHREKVTTCEDCGAGLDCTIEMEPVPYCTITSAPTS